MPPPPNPAPPTPGQADSSAPADSSARAETVAIVLPHRERFGPDAAGAVAMVVQRLAAGQSRHPVLVVGPPHGGAGFPGIDFLPVALPRWLPGTPTLRYAAKLAFVLARRRPALIEVHNKPDVALWLARLLRHPVTLFLHNDPREMRGARSPAARARLLRRLARVVTVSDYLRTCLLEGVATHSSAKEAAAPPRPPMVIHNALDLARLPAPRPTAAREPLILFAGRVVPDKAPDLFIAACAQALPALPGWRAEIIGADGFSATQPDSRFIAGLRAPAAAAGVTLRGHLPHPQVLQAMARAAIVVVPSRWNEPFGLTALEAMACGAPLITSGRGGLAEIAGDAALRIDPADAGSLAAALLRLAADPALRTTLATAGLARAQLFDLPAAMAKLDQLRQDALRPPPSRSGSLAR